MLFNSFQFFIFFPIVTFLYFALPRKFRWLLLLAASCVFYMVSSLIYILIPIYIILVSYFAGIFIEKSKESKRKLSLVVSIVFICTVLFVFKYLSFFNVNLGYVVRLFYRYYPIQHLSLILPVGLSFYTFRSMSYVIEIYRKNQKSERNIGIYALYVMFYPELLAGPIERPQNLLHQFYEDHHFDYRRVTDGLKLIVWGMFQKIVIADRLAMLVNTIYDNPTDYHGITLVITTFFYAFQIFCDFSGYSDMVIGIGQVMGFKLMNNFNRPYFSKSIAEFWRRWHISLLTWFRDYIYIPLGGNRVSVPRHYFNVLVVFFVSGLWHGANWTFIIWGVLHAFYMIFSLATRYQRERLIRITRLDKIPIFLKILRVFTTFGLVCFAWIFFRANSVSDAIYIISNLFSGYIGLSSFSELLKVIASIGIKRDFAISVFLIGIIVIIHLIQRGGSIREMLAQKPAWVRWIIYYVGIMSIIFLGVLSSSQQFVYFQF